VCAFKSRWTWLAVRPLTKLIIANEKTWDILLIDICGGSAHYRANGVTSLFDKVISVSGK
jgi:hypothetical protein